jgi:predicted ATPase with chaperone activity
MIRSIFQYCRLQQLEASTIHSVAGALKPDRQLVTEPPSCAPRHAAAKAAIVAAVSGAIGPVLFRSRTAAARFLT